jgi:hypothetical protein
MIFPAKLNADVRRLGWNVSNPCNHQYTVTDRADRHELPGFCCT